MNQRGDSMGHRAANASDYSASGKLRCPRCGKAMIGTRATGKTKTYRYYTCWTLQRYGSAKCDMPRLNADQLDQALLNGDDEDINRRLAKLRAKRQQLRDRKIELEHVIAEQPTAPDPATLEHVAQHIGQIVRTQGSGKVAG